MRYLTLLFVPLFFYSTVFSQNNTQWRDKIDERLLERLATGSEAEFLVILQQQADLRPAEQYLHKEDKGRFVYETCLAVAETTQQPLRNLLKTKNVPIQTFWVINAVWSKGALALVEQIAQMPEVARVEDNPVWNMQPRLQDSPATVLADRQTALSWGLTKIKADSVWLLGFQGSGVVVGGQDTGYEWNHPALKAKYRGWNNGTADHNYNWHDAIHALINGGANSCGIDLNHPCDDNNHGTHTMGTMTGGPNTDSIIGVAPGAKWMGCRNMEEGDGTPTTYIECFQWFIAPTNTSNGSPNTAMAPHVINNSWGCPGSEGCTPSNYATMETVVNTVRSAGILVVVSAGNDGPGCSTVNTPAPIYTGSFSVGATNSNDDIANFSSRGPVTVYTSTMKPNISAPGVSILSCTGHDNNSSSHTYAGNWSGTSMAGPHVAGVAALMMCARPDLKGNVTVLETLMKNSAVPRYASSPFCGTDNGTSRPNNVYGWGRINAKAAVLAALAFPVELLSFSVENAGKSALARWATSSEANCDFFEIERSSDAIHWVKIGQLGCTGGAGTEAQYAFEDTNPLPGASYYRLRQVDVTGMAAYSSLAMLHRASDHISLRLAAQPLAQTLWVDIAGVGKDENWQMELHSIDGRWIQNFTTPVAGGGAVALPYLATGLYMVSLKNENGQVVAMEKLWWMR